MKWLVIIIVIVLVLAAFAALAWLRAARQGPHTVSSHRPHRLDDSLTVSETGEPAVDTAATELTDHDPGPRSASTRPEA